MHSAGAPFLSTAAASHLPRSADSGVAALFHVQLADDLEAYPPEWTAASAASVLGFALRPILWLSTALLDNAIAASQPGMC